MNLSDPRVAEKLIEIMDTRIQKALAKHRPRFFVTGTIATTSPLTVYIQGSDVAVPVQNPNNITLNVADTVAIIFPNCVDNANRFIIFKY